MALAGWVVVAALAGSPRVAARADAAVYLPNVGELSDLLPFAEAAGKHASLLSPASWRGELHPLLFLDLTRPASLAEAGVDAAGAATVNVLGRAKLTCVSLSDPAPFRARIEEKLKELGGAWKQKVDGVELRGAAQNGRPVAAYAVKGNQGCAARSNAGSIEPSLPELARLVGNAPPPSLWKGVSSRKAPAYLFAQGSAAAFRGTARSLTAEGVVREGLLPPLRGGGAIPYAPAGGLMQLRARVAPAAAPALARAIVEQVRLACRECDRSALERLADAVSSQLTGNVTLRVDAVRVGQSLRSAEERYFAVRHAYVAEVKDPSAVKALLAPVGEWRGARRTESGFSLLTRNGEIHLGLNGRHLFLGNDGAAERAALGSLEQGASSLSHGAEVSVDPKLLARGLGQIPLLDVVGSAELAGLFAAGVELGPLLSKSERLSGWLDGAGGGHRFLAEWSLAATPGGL